MALCCHCGEEVAEYVSNGIFKAFCTKCGGWTIYGREKIPKKVNLDYDPEVDENALENQPKTKDLPEIEREEPYVEIVNEK